METAQFKIIEGTGDVLLSAPHAFSHRRPNLSGIYKPGEEYICQMNVITTLITTK